MVKVIIKEIMTNYHDNKKDQFSKEIEFINSLKKHPIATIEEMYITCEVDDNKYYLILVRPEGSGMKWEATQGDELSFQVSYEKDKDFLNRFKEELLRALGLYDNDNGPDAQVTMG